MKTARSINRVVCVSMFAAFVFGGVEASASCPQGPDSGEPPVVGQPYVASDGDMYLIARVKTLSPIRAAFALSSACLCFPCAPTFEFGIGDNLGDRHAVQLTDREFQMLAIAFATDMPISLWLRPREWTDLGGGSHYALIKMEFTKRYKEAPESE